MAVTTRSNLKQYFQTGDKPTQAQFEDLIDSFVHLTEGDDNQGQITNTLRISGSESYRPDPLSSVTSQLGMVVSGSILPGDNSAFDLGSKTERWRSGSFGRIDVLHISSSTGTFDANTIFIGGASLSKTDVDEIKEVETNRKSDSGLPIKRLRAFESASTFVDLNSTAGRTKTKGTAIDIFVKNSFEALHIDPSLVSIGPVPGIPLELTGSVKVGASQFVPHEFKGKYEFKGNPDNFGTAGSGVVIQDAAFFNDKGGVVIQPGVISQSLNIGTATSPSINIMDGVGDSCFIRIADGITVRVNDGSIFKIQCPQPDVTVDTDNDTITVSNGGGDETVISTGQFGTNPQYISNHMVVPSGQVAIWYGPIYVGRFTLNPFGSNFDPDGAGVLNMDLAGQGQNASLRIHNGSQIKVQAF